MKEPGFKLRKWFFGQFSLQIHMEPISAHTEAEQVSGLVDLVAFGCTASLKVPDILVLSILHLLSLLYLMMSSGCQLQLGQYTTLCTSTWGQERAGLILECASPCISLAQACPIFLPSLKHLASGQLFGMKWMLSQPQGLLEMPDFLGTHLILTHYLVSLHE